MLNKPVQLFADKKDCCGCEACKDVCHKNAIIMTEDEHGFLYPEINNDLCVGCRSCLRVCCLKKESDLRKPEIVYAASSKLKDISMKSASGGIFSALAKWVIDQDGIVFGTAFNSDFDALVESVEQIDELPKLQGSKYVQSSINNSYKRIKDELKTGRIVLFGGVPCQVEALKNFLGHDYENLLLVDIVCHGVPSNRMLKDYLDFLSKKKKKAVNSIQFRTKTKGQNVAGEIIYKKSGQKEKDQYEREPLVAYKSSYYSLFLKCQTFRESCYHCKFSGSERAGDITLCDYWGIEDEHPDFLKEVSDEGLVGISAVMLNNQTGKNYFSEIERAFKLKESTFEQVAAHNPQLTSPSVESPIRHEILKNYRLNGYEAVDDFYHRKYRLKILTSDLGRVLPNSWKKAILQMIRGRR